MADIEYWLNSGMFCCTNTKDPEDLKESWSNPLTWPKRFPGRFHRVPRAFLARLFEVSTSIYYVLID